MSVAMSVVLSTSRTLLNDDNATLWTDAVLIPKVVQAHRELQTKLRFAAAPVMRKMMAGVTVSAAATGFAAPPTDLVEPIRLWEKAPTDPVTSYVPMTEVDPLPDNLAATTLIYWQWINEAVLFLGASVDRMVKMLYWRAIPWTSSPPASTDTIGFINGELYLAPRVAALAAGSVGDEKVFAAMTALADASLNQVVLSNRGRMPAGSGTAIRP